MRLEERRGRNRALGLCLSIIGCIFLIEFGISYTYLYFFNAMDELLEEPPEYLKEEAKDFTDILEENVTSNNTLETDISFKMEELVEMSESPVFGISSSYEQNTTSEQKKVVDQRQINKQSESAILEINPKGEKLLIDIIDERHIKIDKTEMNPQGTQSPEKNESLQEDLNMVQGTDSAIQPVEEIDRFLDYGFHQGGRQKKADEPEDRYSFVYHPLLRVNFETDKKNFTEADQACREKYEMGRLMVFYNRREEESLTNQLWYQSYTYFLHCPQIFIGYRSVPLKKWTVPPRALPFLPLEYLNKWSLELNPGIQASDTNCATIQYFEKRNEFQVKSTRCSGGRYHCYMCEIPMLSNPAKINELQTRFDWCYSSTCFSLRSSPYFFSRGTTHIRRCRKSNGRLALIANKTVSFHMQQIIKKLRYSHKFRCRTEKIFVYNVNPTMLFETIREEPMVYHPNRVEYGMSVDNCLSISRELNFTWVFTSCNEPLCYICRDDELNPPPNPEPDLPLASRYAQFRTTTTTTRVPVLPPLQYDLFNKERRWVKKDQAVRERDKYLSENELSRDELDDSEDNPF